MHISHFCHFVSGVDNLERSPSRSSGSTCSSLLDVGCELFVVGCDRTTSWTRSTSFSGASRHGFSYNSASRMHRWPWTRIMFSNTALACVPFVVSHFRHSLRNIFKEQEGTVYVALQRIGNTALIGISVKFLYPRYTYIDGHFRKRFSHAVTSYGIDQFLRWCRNVGADYVRAFAKEQRDIRSDLICNF